MFSKIEKMHENREIAVLTGYGGRDRKSMSYLC